MTKMMKETREKVKRFLKDIYGKNYGQMVTEVDDSFIVRRGSAAVHVKVKPLSTDDCIVQAFSYVVHGAKIGPKLLTNLMRWNANSPIGAYGLTFDDTIIFSHSIAGAHLDRNELRTTVGTVAFVADETDDMIIKVAGGSRAVDGQLTFGAEESSAKSRKAKKRPAKKAAKRPAAFPAGRKKAKRR